MHLGLFVMYSPLLSSESDYLRPWRVAGCVLGNMQLRSFNAKQASSQMDALVVQV